MFELRGRAAASTLLLAVALLVTSCGAGGAPSTPAATSRLLTVSTPASSDGRKSPPIARTPAVGGSASRAASPVPTAAPTPARRVIVIDPGHSGRSIRGKGPNGLRDIDYPNYPEIYEMFDVSACVAEALRSDGYRVLLTKTHPLSTVSHSQRAAVANDDRADLAISVHDDHGATQKFQATYSQRGVRRADGSYPLMYRGRGSHRTVYQHPETAERSERYAELIAAARSQVQGRPVSVRQNSFDGRAPLEPGNLALVQLLSRVPWVYNEMGALTDGRPARAMSIASETAYARGLLAGVRSAVPLPKTPASDLDSASRMRSCLVRQVEPAPGQLTRPQKYLPDGFKVG